MRKLNVNWRYLGVSVFEYLFNALMTFAVYVVIGLVIMDMLIRLSHFDLSFLELGFDFEVKESVMQFLWSFLFLAVLIGGVCYVGRNDKSSTESSKPTEEGKL